MNKQTKGGGTNLLSLNLLQYSDFLNSPSFTLSLKPMSMFPGRKMVYKLILVTLLTISNHSSWIDPSFNSLMTKMEIKPPDLDFCGCEVDHGFWNRDTCIS